MSQKDIYTKDALIYNPLLDNLTESVMSGDKRHEFLNLIRQIESGGKYRPLLGTTDFPYVFINLQKNLLILQSKELET